LPAGAECAGIEGWLDRFASLRVLVVGDLLLDEYRSGEVDRISPEAPVPVVRVQSIGSAPGGAANVARGIVALGASCELIGLVDEDPQADELLDHLRQTGIPTDGVLRTPQRPTSHKLRVVARSQQMLRLDREVAEPIDAGLADRLQREVERQMDRCDVVVLQDYDKGIFGEGLAHSIIALARLRGVPVVADPKTDLGRFRGASVVKPNLDEARRFVAGAAGRFEDRRAMLEKIQEELGGSAIVVTRGREGMTALDLEGESFDVPTRPAEVFDVQGAGDTSLAVLALARAAGASLREGCVLANAAASLAVGKAGTAVVELAELRECLREQQQGFRGEM
jgi:D-beta-D-heptose 7-phosphate kinase/D-beta-D-heptose 1-phosphate adenosyltransferase